MMPFLPRFLPRSFVASLAAWLVLVGLATQAHAAGTGVHGRVQELTTSADKPPAITGASIEFQDQARNPVGKPVKSRADGYYQADLAPGTYFYKVQATGFRTEDAGRGCILVLNEGYAVLNFSLVKGKDDPKQQPPEIIPAKLGTLQGRVVVKGTDVGIPGATVSLHKKGGGPAVEARTRDGEPKAQGLYGTTLEVGTYQATVTAAGYQPLTDAKPIEIREGETTRRDFELTRPAVTVPAGQGIRGTIALHGTTSPPVKLSDVTVTIVPLSEPNTPPDAKGQFTRDLPAGSYEVVAAVKGYRRASSGQRAVYAGKYTVVNLTLEPLPSPEPPKVKLIPVECWVYERTAERQKRPLPGVGVLLRKEGAPLADAVRGKTGPLGSVTLQVSGASRYDFLARLGSRSGGAKVEVAVAGPNRVEVVLEAPAAPTLEVHVIGIGGDQRPGALEGATVMVTQKGANIDSGKTDASGICRIGKPLTPGDYDVTVAKKGYKSETVPVKLAEDHVVQRVLLRFLTQPIEPPPVATAYLNARIRDARTAEGIGGATVVVRQIVDGKRGERVAQGLSDGDGYFVSKELLPHGTYAIEATHPRYQPGSREIPFGSKDVTWAVQLTPRDQPPVEPLPATTAYLYVRVRDARTGEPVTGASIVTTGPASIKGISGTDGGFVSEKPLPHGNYVVDVTHSSYEPGRRTDVQLGTRELTWVVNLTPKTANLYVRIRDAKTGESVSGASIAVRGPASVRGSSRPDGTFVSEKPLPHGNYVVDVTHASYQPGRRTDLQLGPKEVTWVVDLTPTVKPPVPRQTILQVTVVSERNLTVAGATIVVKPPERGMLGKTDTKGIYTTPVNPGVTYQVEARQGDWRGQATVIVPEENAPPLIERTIKLVLPPKVVVPPAKLPPLPPPPAAWLHLDVKFGSPLKPGNPVPGAAIAIRDAKRQLVNKESDQSSREGQFSIRLPAGEYTLEVTHPKCRPAPMQNLKMTGLDVRRPVYLMPR